jgi:hypothetical protein
MLFRKNYEQDKMSIKKRYVQSLIPNVLLIKQYKYWYQKNLIFKIFANEYSFVSIISFIDSSVQTPSITFNFNVLIYLINTAVSPLGSNRQKKSQFRIFIDAIRIFMGESRCLNFSMSIRFFIFHFQHLLNSTFYHFDSSTALNQNVVAYWILYLSTKINCSMNSK